MSTLPTFPGFPIGLPALPADAPALSERERAYIEQRVSIYSDPAVRQAVAWDIEKGLRNISAIFANQRLWAEQQARRRALLEAAE